MQFVTYKEANKTGGNFYSERGKETRNKQNKKPKQNRNTKSKQSGKRERGRERALRRQCGVDKIKPCESIL